MANEFVLDDTTVERLEQFLADPQRPQGTFTFDELLGFLFTVASCPAEIPEDEWMEVVFDGQDPMCQDFEETEFLYAALATLLGQLEQEAANNESHLPQRCQARPEAMDNFQQDAPLSHWCNGFLAGHGSLEEAWEDLPEEIDEEVGACVMTLSFFAEQDLAASYHKEFAQPEESLAKMAAAMIAEFDGAMQAYAEMGHGLRSQFVDLD